jgi:hypothetical protein
MTSNNNQNPQPSEPTRSGKTIKKRTILKAILIGFAVGVMFIVSAKMVNMVIT